VTEYNTQSLSIIPFRKVKELEKIVPNPNELWGFGDFGDKAGGLWSSMLVLDGKPDVTYKDAENGEQLGTHIQFFHHNINYIFVEAHTWVACAVVQVRPECDANLEPDMVWAVEPGEAPGDERPQHIEEDEHRFCMCVILYLVYVLYFTQVKRLSIILSSWV
jgi:hypothetical protein